MLLELVSLLDQVLFLLLELDFPFVELVLHVLRLLLALFRIGDQKQVFLFQVGEDLLQLFRLFEARLKFLI